MARQKSIGIGATPWGRCLGLAKYFPSTITSKKGLNSSTNIVSIRARYEFPVEAGVKLSFEFRVAEVLNKFKVVPSRLMSNSWKIIRAVSWGSGCLFSVVPEGGDPKLPGGCTNNGVSGKTPWVGELTKIYTKTEEEEAGEAKKLQIKVAKTLYQDETMRVKVKVSLKPQVASKATKSRFEAKVIKASRSKIRDKLATKVITVEGPKTTITKTRIIPSKGLNA
ncbi:hypothetical protein ACLOJK_032901 [Asimina triloba]